VEDGAATSDDDPLRVRADALGAGFGAADLERAGAMLDRVYRALDEPATGGTPHDSVAISSRHDDKVCRAHTRRECGQQECRGAASPTFTADRPRTVRAVVVTRSGGPEVLELREQPTPQPGAGQLLVDVDAAGVNYRDIYEREGSYGGSPPFVAGAEGAGTVTAVGEGVTEHGVGDLVGWISAPGSYAEQVVVDARRAVPLPDGVSSELAAAALLQGVTAHYLAHGAYSVQPGDDVLVHAAAGGVGLLLIQVLKLRRARVIGTTSTDEKAQRATRAGADEVIGYEGFLERVRELTGGRGVDVVYDGVGQATFDGSLASLRPRGMMVLYGAASGRVPPFDPMRLENEGSLFLTRPSTRHYAAEGEELLARAGDVFAWIAEDKLEVHIGGRYALADAARAHEDLAARRTSGKLLLLPRAGEAT
jgi:NADPH2:quinone reductase